MRLLTFFFLISFSNAFTFNFIYKTAVNFAIFYSNKVLDEMEQNQCSHDLKKLLKDFKYKKEWAERMVDATVKPQSALLLGNVGHSSDFYECLNINDGNIQGKYCQSDVSVAFERNTTALLLEKISTGILKENILKIRNLRKGARAIFGICVPASCKANDLQNISDYIGEMLQLPIIAKFKEESCELLTDNHTTQRQYFGYIFFAIFGLIILASTLKDVWEKPKKSIYIIFSAYTNLKFLFTPAKSDNPLQVLNGIKAISAMWVIFGHSFLEYTKAPSINTIHFMKFRDELKFCWLIGAPMSVDTFLTITGFLIIHISLNRKVKFSGIKFLLHRYFRLTPALIATLIFYTTILIKMGNGPYWFMVQNIEKTCVKYWWSVLLYSQHLTNLNEFCIRQTWYLSVDMHLSLIAPLIFLNIKKRTKRTLLCIYTIILATSLYAFWTTVKYNLGFKFSDFNLDFMTFIYFLPQFRIAPWLIGMLWAYYLFESNKFKCRISTISVLAAWLVTFITMVIIMAVHTIIPSGYIYANAVFHAFARPAWATCIGWIIFACYKGYGGIVNTFLAHKIFTLPSRLSYCMYLVHFAVIYISFYQRRHPYYLSFALLIFDFWGIYVFTFLVSIILHLGFEAPLLNLESFYKKRYEAMKTTSSDLK